MGNSNSRKFKKLPLDDMESDNIEKVVLLFSVLEVKLPVFFTLLLEALYCMFLN